MSGPAGGVVGYAATTYHQQLHTSTTDTEHKTPSTLVVSELKTSVVPGDNKLPVIGFDMGGTSTDVSRYAGEYEHVFETTTAGITVQAPQVSQ